MEALLVIFYIVLFIFGILQIILFFKIWGMTNDVREMKNKYMSDNYIRKIEDNRKTICKSNQVNDKNTSSSLKNTFKTESLKKENITQELIITPIKKAKKEDIDIENEDFKKLINRWDILKKRGYTQQAINEYIERTSLTYEEAKKFIDEL